MRIQYTNPVSSISGRTNIEGGLTFRRLGKQNLSSRATAPDPIRTARRSQARTMFAVLKSAYAQLTPDQVYAWSGFCTQLQNRKHPILNPKTPWAAYYAINSTRRMSGTAATATPPPINPTFSFVSVRTPTLKLPPISWITFYVTLDGTATDNDWVKVQISKALPTHQRHASPSELLLGTTISRHPVVHPTNIRREVVVKTTPLFYENNDWINYTLTPYNTEFLPGLPAHYVGVILTTA